MADNETRELPALGTFVLAEMGRNAVVMGDVRDITSHIGKTVAVHADGETVRVKLATRWESTRTGKNRFPLYAETGEVKRNGEPRRKATGYFVGAAFVGEVNAEPMSFGDAMTFLTAGLDAANAAPAATGKGKGTGKGTAAPAAETPATTVPDHIATTVAMLITGGMPPADAAAVGVAMRAAETATAAPATPATVKTPRGKGKGTAETPAAPATRGKRGPSRVGTGKGTAATVDAMLGELSA